VKLIALRSRQVCHSFDPSESDRIKPTCWWKPHPLFLLFPPGQMGVRLKSNIEMMQVRAIVRSENGERANLPPRLANLDKTNWETYTALNST
jgi:hypothetical protein